jgi:signal peptidase I
MGNLQKAEKKWLKPYPHAGFRDNIEVVLVAVTVALGIRTFFLQPFKIPTGSMQPTLYGITAIDLRDQPDAAIPNGLVQFFDKWVTGVSHYRIVARSDGMLEAYEPPKMLIPFVYKQRFKVGDVWYSVWSSWDRFLEHAGVVDPRGIRPLKRYRKGDDIVKLKVLTGDHLFVDRLTYNFRRPRRGEIIVFETRGIRSLVTGQPIISPDTFYIKRLVAMDGERVQIGDDRHLIINGRRLDHNDPHFENVYSFDPKQPPKPSTYSGHVNGTVASQFNREGLAPLFPDAMTVFTVRRKQYLVMGDNTMDSSDGRSWGDFSRTNLIGKFCFVYWPMSRRFGWAPR